MAYFKLKVLIKKVGKLVGTPTKGVEECSKDNEGTSWLETEPHEVKTFCISFTDNHTCVEQKISQDFRIKAYIDNQGIIIDNKAGKITEIPLVW